MNGLKSAWARSVLLVMLTLLTFTAGGAIWAAPESSDQPLSQEPQVLLALVQKQGPSEGADVVILKDEERYRYEADGRTTYTEHVIYGVLTSDGVADWASVGCEWEPWHQDRPTVEARVITPDGKVHALDAATVVEVPVNPYVPDIYLDRRAIQAPLPAVTVGAVVEHVVRLVDKTPYFDAGHAARVFPRRWVPVGQYRLVLDAPAGLPLKYRVRSMPDLTPRRDEADQRVTLTFDAGPIEAYEDIETMCPPEDSPVPCVVFSTGKSWQDVARSYYDMVEAAVKGADVSAIVDPIVRENADVRSRVDQLAGWLAQNIRYTGVEFGENSLVPHALGDILARKYGDCKDKAALLVAMLRAAGLPAHVAILASRASYEVEPDLPGMGLFDHAIVVVTGEQWVWIDPTDEYSRPGHLPPDDQGRWALVIRPETTGLVRTPESTSADNEHYETREFYLAETGRARVVETVELTGAIEADYRSDYDDPDPKSVREALESYVKDEYTADELLSYDVGRSDDLSAHFRMKIEAGKAGRGVTESTTAVVGVMPASLTEHLPYVITDSEEPDPDAEMETRQHDLVLDIPYRAQFCYRIIPPPGFKAAPLPENHEEWLGPVLYARRFTLEPDGTVTAIVELDTVKRRFTPHEVIALQDKVRELTQADGIIVSFDQIGESLLARGQVREALSEFQKLAALHPTEALHQTQIARALLEAGFGRAAAGAARKATELEPKSGLAYATLGTVLSHDQFGRQFEEGFDRKGAEEAYRKAVELEPDDLNHKVNLAIVLEHDATGVRYSRDADLDAAIKIYQSIRKDLEGTTYRHNLPIACMWAKRFDDLKELYRRRASGKGEEEYVLLAIAATDGIEAAIKEASRLCPAAGDRNSSLFTAGTLLLNLRLYPQAAALLRAGAAASPNVSATLALADRLPTMTALTYAESFENTPTGVVRQFLLGSFQRIPFKKLRELLADEMLEDVSTEEEAMKAERQLRSGLKRLEKTQLPLEVVGDLMVSMAQFSPDGSDELGWRIRIFIPESPGVRNLLMYVVKDSGRYRILADRSDLIPVGRHVLNLVKRGEVDAARKWLDWVREETEAPGGDDPLDGSSLPRFWSVGDTGGPDAIRWAAATLFLARADEPGIADGAIAILEKGAVQAADEAAQTRCELALSVGYLASARFEPMLKTASRLHQRYPDSERALLLNAWALDGSGRPADAEQLLREYIARKPRSVSARRVLADTLLQSGRAAEAVRELQAQVESGLGDGLDINNAAWYSLFNESTRSEGVALAQKLASSTSEGGGRNVHTLATVMADAGRLDEARSAFLKYIDQDLTEEVMSNALLIYGRMAEQYGLKDLATESYRAVKKPDQPLRLESSSFVLAQRWFARISGESAPAAQSGR
ncbi:MAG: DUF3857 domain-containing protein [Acidobacteriota bacterium]